MPIENILEAHRPNPLMGAGIGLFDRYFDNGGVRGQEFFLGRMMSAEIVPSVNRARVDSGSGSVATPIVNKVISVERSINLVIQESTMDNFSLFLFGNAPEARAAQADTTLTKVVPVEALNRNPRQYINLTTTASDPIGSPRIRQLEGWAITVTTGATQGTQTTAYAKAGAEGANADRLWLNALSDGMFRLAWKRKAGSNVANDDYELVGSLPAGAKFIKIVATKINVLGHGRVSVDSGPRQVRGAFRYVEDPDQGAQGRCLYVPQCSLSANGAMQLMSRSETQNIPLSLQIENPGDGLAEVTIDEQPVI